MVYGAAADNPVPLDEDAPLRAVAGRSGDRRPARGRGDRPRRRAGAPRAAGHRGAAGRCWSGRASTACSPGTSRRRGCSWSRTRTRTGSSATSTTWCRRWCWPRSAASTAPSRSASDGYLDQDEVEAVTGMRRIELPARHRVRHRRAAAPARDDARAGQRAGVHRRALGGAVHPAAGRGLGARVRQRTGARRAGRGDAARRPRGRPPARAATPRSAPPARRSPCWARRPWCGRSGASAEVRRRLGSAPWTPQRARCVLASCATTPLSRRRGARRGRATRARRHRASSSAPSATTTTGRGVTGLDYSAHPPPQEHAAPGGRARVARRARRRRAGGRAPGGRAARSATSPWWSRPRPAPGRGLRGRPRG